jgi:hypothetical protein
MRRQSSLTSGVSPDSSCTPSTSSASFTCWRSVDPQSGVISHLVQSARVRHPSRATTRGVTTRREHVEKGSDVQLSLYTACWGVSWALEARARRVGCLSSVGEPLRVQNDLSRSALRTTDLSKWERSSLIPDGVGFADIVDYSDQQWDVHR